MENKIKHLLDKPIEEFKQDIEYEFNKLDPTSKDYLDEKRKLQVNFRKRANNIIKKFADTISKNQESIARKSKRRKKRIDEKDV
jgi:hypothetical protein